MVLSVKDRGDIVKAAKACAICLHSSHTADRCYNKDKDIYICGVNGCQSNHHPCLHGSKDSYVTGVNVLVRQQLLLHSMMLTSLLVIGWKGSNMSMIAI